MDVKQSFALSDAQIIAVAVGHRLKPFCDRLNIAGSIRRRKAYVKDIELVAQPKKSYVQSYDLFGNEQPEEMHLDKGFVDTVESLGKIIKGKAYGRMMQIELPEGIALDLFMPEPQDYYRQYAIRTGSAIYSQKIIATAWTKLGWVGTPDGLRKRHECEEKKHGDKSTWVCKVDNPALPPSWSSEEEFFKWLEIPYLKPEQRNY